jgi:hypothetical protein
VNETLQVLAEHAKVELDDDALLDEGWFTDFFDPATTFLSEAQGATGPRPDAGSRCGVEARGSGGRRTGCEIAHRVGPIEIRDFARGYHSGELGGGAGRSHAREEIPAIPAALGEWTTVDALIG